MAGPARHSPALWLGAAAPRLERTPVPARGGCGRPAGTALRVSALNSHVSPGAPWLPAKCEWPGAGKSRWGRAGAPRRCLPALRLPGTPQFSLFSFLLSIGAPKSQPKERLRVTANSCHRVSALFFFSCLTFLGAFWFFAVVGCFLVCSRPFFICSSFLALTLRQLAQQPEAGQPRSAAPGQRVGHRSGDPRHGAHGVPPGRGQGQAGRPGQAGTRQPEVAQQPC